MALATIIFGVVMLVQGHHDPVDPRLQGEAMGLSHLQDVHYLFYTPGSHDDVAGARPELLVELKFEKEFARASQAPEVFREYAHLRRFDAVLLSGDPTTFEPLLRHLGDSPDFVLTWIDSEVLIFRHVGAKPWSEADLRATADALKGENRARYLAGVAKRLVAIGGGLQMALAKRALDEAMPLGKRIPEMWTALALYDGHVGHWTDALDEVNKALALDPDSTAALTTKAEIFLGAKRLDEALDISDKVVEKHPDDASMLFMHATIAHQAHAYQQEVAALKHLIALAEAQGHSTTGYQIYLGQAYAESGDAVNSLAAFKVVLAASDASPGQKKFAAGLRG